MKSLYKIIETAFEKFSMMATRVLGNSLTFLMALILVITYFTDKEVYARPKYLIIMDVIFSKLLFLVFLLFKNP